jgi:predicted ATP-grasp superfamily ATP-dependent carboligase
MSTNNSCKKILLLEYVTGGGLCDQALPTSFAVEGHAMLDALLSDCQALIPEVQITVLRDERLCHASNVMNTEHITYVQVKEEFELIWRKQLAWADVVWIIAPETGGVLTQLVTQACSAGKRVINAKPDAIALCTSKLSTAQHLQLHDISTVDTYAWHESLRDHPPAALRQGLVIVKPDDGAGCLRTQVFDGYAALVDAADAFESGDVIQAFIAGEALSLCLWCEAGHAQLLSINQQLIARDDQGALSFKGCVVNVRSDDLPLRESCLELGERIAQSLPSLYGPVGVDLIERKLDDGTPELIVIEINPRMTTSFTALREACGINLAELAFHGKRQENAYAERSVRIAL